MLARVSGVLIASNIEPRPSVESALLDVCYVVRRQIVAQFVALVHRGPKLARGWMDRQAYRIADAVSVNAQAAPVGVEFQDIGAMKFLPMRVGVVDVRMRAYRDE